jgi:hypothetical protein
VNAYLVLLAISLVITSAFGYARQIHAVRSYRQLLLTNPDHARELVEVIKATKTSLGKKLEL